MVSRLVQLSHPDGFGALVFLSPIIVIWAAVVLIFVHLYWFNVILDH